MTLQFFSLVFVVDGHSINASLSRLQLSPLNSKRLPFGRQGENDASDFAASLLN
jgi:hypothetical protein